MFLVSCGMDEPYFMSVDITNCDIHIINESFMELSPEALQLEIYLKTKDLDSLQRSKFFVKLSIAPKARMEDVSLVQREFQKANILKIKYYEIGNVTCGGF
ncbi:hypothetical protein [uncultured Winogradskyella sp.]|uniref:hypothetical protein n=1 Tax=uncultured Winogradskyella sp. TaxID=395353 RepID=UPI0026328A19|nr:hypothetical protein [uncultured Winogradskyella sp.]